ncbi:MAG: hypothetical protein SFY96_00205 [Planctomycetota bacterium]|nr:hypothetical protein [Planctomycetota bacterium]
MKRERLVPWLCAILCGLPIPSAIDAAQAQPVPERASDPARPLRAWRLQINGDMVCSSLAGLLGEEITRAKAAHAEAMIVQLSAVHWRGDVALAMARTVRDAGLPVHVVLRPHDSERVGVGALIVALAATSAWMTPGASVQSGAGDRAPGLVTTVKAQKDENAALTEIIDAALVRRGAPVELGPLLVTPSGARWLATVDGAPRITDDASAGSDAVPVLTNEVDGVRLAIGSSLAMRARLIDGERGGDSVFKKMGYLPARPKAEPALRDEFTLTPDATIACDPDGEYRELCAAFTGLDSDFDRVQQLLDPPGDGKPTTTAKSEAERELTNIRSTLDEIDRRLKSSAELSQRPVPGQSEVGVKPSAWTSKWRSAIQKKRDQITRLLAKTK